MGIETNPVGVKVNRLEGGILWTEPKSVTVDGHYRMGFPYYGRSFSYHAIRTGKDDDVLEVLYEDVTTD